MKIHPAAEMIPAMTDDEFEDLKADIKAHGLHTPIERLDGQLLDGRHRYRACKAVGVSPEFIDVDLHSIGGCPYAYVISANAKRRHLTESQRAMIGAAAAHLFAKGAAERMKAGKPTATGHKGSCAELAGDSVGVSARSVARAMKVKVGGSPELQEAVRDGKVSVSAAEKIVASSASKGEQNKKLERKISGGTSFDIDEIEAATAVAEKPRRNGRPVVSAKDRKECLVHHGKLCRSLKAVGIYEEFIEPLSQIVTRLRQV